MGRTCSSLALAWLCSYRFSSSNLTTYFRLHPRFSAPFFRRRCTNRLSSPTSAYNADRVMSFFRCCRGSRPIWVLCCISDPLSAYSMLPSGCALSCSTSNSSHCAGWPCSCSRSSWSGSAWRPRPFHPRASPCTSATPSSTSSLYAPTLKWPYRYRQGAPTAL